METKIKIVLDLYKDGKITIEQATTLLQKDVEYCYYPNYYLGNPINITTPITPDYYTVTCFN